jgi:NDP-sugar pyrophosphorylase family protein
MSRILRVYDGLDRSLAYRGRPFERMYMTDFIQQLIDAGVEVRPARITHGWLEVDTIQDHEHYERLRREGTLDRFCRLD